MGSDNTNIDGTVKYYVDGYNSNSNVIVSGLPPGNGILDYVDLFSNLFYLNFSEINPSIVLLALTIYSF